MSVHINYYKKALMGSFWLDNRLLLLISAGALVLRLLVLFTDGSRMFLGTDDDNYRETAETLLRSGILTYGGWKELTVFIMPGYPLLLAGIFWLVGSPSWLAARLFQAAVSVIGVWITFKLGFRLGGRRVGFLAAVFTAVYPPNLTAPCFLLTETVFTCLLLLSLLVFMRAEDSKNLRWYLVTGIVLALATYFRPTSGLLPIVFGVFLILRGYSFRKAGVSVLVMGAVIGLCLTPWIVRNYIIYHEFIPFTVSGGNPFLRGTYVNDIIDERFPWVEGNRILSDRAQMEYGEKRLITGFRNNFRVYLHWYTIGKFANFWGEPYYYKELTYLSGRWVDLFHRIMLLLGTGGVIAGLWRKGSRGVTLLFLLVSGYFTALHLVYLSAPRYSYPVVQLLIILAAYMVALPGISQPNDKR
ncbi:MAG: glycosyltransferase family 39 protein [Thermincola sp.]|jgi:4-amino-4-deoxy-L-arabinose transferase-like glycosyltransferase|nr:glycosyltransferase family 39 protein [Thermincola sp.]MDT3702185.1 glycosyltransferase family 39 protein [Thermincola sp.]